MELTGDGKEKLDEKGFVFIDGHGRPYWCRIYFENPWFMYWHEHQKSWVTLRKVNQTDICRANEMRIPEEQADFYHELHSEFEKRIYEILNSTTNE